MMIMRPPQHGHGCERVGGSVSSVAAASAGSASGSGMARQFACPRDVVGTGGFGEQPVVADAMEALRQDVAEEAADELAGCEGHELVARTAVGTIVLVLEGDAALVAGDQPAVGDGDAVGVARQISEHGLGSAKRGL